MEAETPPAEGVRHESPGNGNRQVERETSAAPVRVDTPPSRQNPGSVQRLLEKEGHDARNVVSWLVPNRTGGGGSGGSLVFDARTGGCSVPRGQRGDRDGQEVSREREIGRRKSSPIASPLKGSSSSMSSKGTPGFRVRSGSDSTAHGFNQRLWGYLFRNVNRAVDELYYLCEAECSATHCTEAAELLEGCSRDFTKLVERIAAQTRFEEEQRAARAAERAGPEGELGGDSSAESGGRKPKGLVWEVRKTTSASTASAMVLTAIERMESHHTAPRGGGIPRVVPVAPPCPPPPRATSSLKPRSPASGATGSCGGGGQVDGVAASEGGAGCGRKNEEQRVRDSRKGTEERCRASSGDVGFVATIDENLDMGIVGGAGELGGPGRVSRLELNDRVEDGEEGTVPRVGLAVPGDGGGDDDTAASDGSLATRRGGQSTGGCVGAGPYNVDPGDGHRTRACRVYGHDREGEDGRSVKRRPEEDGREGAEGTRVRGGREKKQADQGIGPHPSCGKCFGCAETTRTSSGRSTVATVLEADDSKGKENAFREQQRVASAAAPANGATASAREEHERKSSADSRRPSSLTDPQKSGVLGSGDADSGTRRDSPAPTVAPRTRPCGSRLNPRAAPFTYIPGERRASARVSYPNPTLPGCAGETRRSQKMDDVNVPPAELAMNVGEAPPRSLPPTTTTTTPASTASCPTTMTARAASAAAPYNPKLETWMGSSDAEVLSVADSSGIGGVGPWPRIKHTVPLPPRTPSPPTGHHSDAAASQRSLRPRSSGRSRSLSGGYSDVDESRAAVSASNDGYPKPRETKGKNAPGGVSAAPTLLPPESKWLRRPKLTPDCATATSADNRTTSGRHARRLVPGASQRGPRKTTQPRDARVPYPRKLCNIGRKSGNVGVTAAVMVERAAAGGGRGGDGLPIEKRGRRADDPALPRAGVAARCGERCPDLKDGGGDGMSGEDSTVEARAGTLATCPIKNLDQRRRPEAPVYDAGGVVSSLGRFGGGGSGGDDDAAGTDDAGVATETDCCEEQDPDSAYVMEMERIWAEAEALVDAEAQAEEEAWARLPTEVPCPSESEEVTSDVEDACQFARATESGRAGRKEGSGLQTDPRDDVPPDPHPSDLEIEIPASAESVGVGDEEQEASSSLSGGRRRDVEDDRLGDTKGLGSEDADPDYHPVLEDTNNEDQGKDINGNIKGNSNSREEDVNERLARCAGGSPSGDVLVGPSGRGGPCHKSPGSPAGASGGCCYDNAAPRSEAESSSEVSCFRNERGSCCHETIDEGWAALSYRELQKKLSSPQRKPQRKLLSAAEAKLRQERRQMVAELNRAQLASGMAEKLKQQEERARGVRFRKEEQLMRAEEEARKRMESADARRREHRRGIVRKANDANSKVKEVLFMNKLTVEDLKITLQMQMSEVDRRIQSGRARRQRLLAGISDRQKKRTKDKAAQMSERRLEAEEAAAMRWEALQKRLEAVQERRRDRELETRRRMQAADRHRQARERREAMLQQNHGGAGKVPQRRQRGADGKIEAESLLASQEAKERRPREEALATNQSSRPSPSRGCDESVASAGESWKDCTEGHIRIVGNSIGVGVGTGADVFDANACPASLLPPSVEAVTDGRLAPRSGGGWQKRGRGQKKRAKKIKDKLRQLCLEATTEASTPAAAAGSSTADASSHGAEEAEIRTEESNPRVSSLGGSRPAGSGETNDGSGEKHQRGDRQGKPCPRLTRAVEDLAALTRAYERCCQKPPAPLPKQSKCSELGAGLLRAADWSDVPNGALPRPEKRSLVGADAVVSPTLSLGSPEPSKAKGGSHESGPACVRIASATSFVGPVGSHEKLSPPVCQTVREGNSGGGAVARTAAVPAEDVGRGANCDEEKPQHQQQEEDVSVGEGGASAFGDKGAPGGEKALPHYKKTRRGKRSGAATTRRRGHKARAGGENMALVDWSGGDGNSPHVEERRGVEEEAAMEAEVVLPASSSRDRGAQGGKYRSQAGDGDRGENSWSGSGRTINSGRVSASVAALEFAALRSLRNLRSALPAATTFRGKTGLRESGILESLVEICAPASWNPVPLLVGAASSVLPSPTGRTPVHHHGSSLRLGFNDEEAERNGGCPVTVSSRDGLREAVMGAALVILRRVLEEPENRDRLLRVDGAAPLVDCLARLLERAVRSGFNTLPHSPLAARPVLMPEAEAWDARLATTDTSPLDDSSRQNGMKKKKPSVCGDGDKEDARTAPKTGGVDKAVPRADGVTVVREAVCGPEEEDENGEEALMEALGVVTLLIRHESAPADADDDTCLRIQDELVRYLVAKRLMSDLAVFLHQLQPRCGDEDTTVGASSGRKKGSPSVGDSGIVQPSGLAPAAAASTIQLHPEAWGSASDPCRSRRRCRQSFPLARLVARIAELADAVLSYPLRARRPRTPSSTRMALQSVRCRPSSNPGTENESPLINGRGEEHRSPGGADILSSKPRCRSRCGSEEGLEVCRSVEDLRRGYAAARPEFCGVVREDPGSTRVAVELLSLMAAMAGTREGTRRGPEWGDGSAPGARGTLALSDALLRLASLVVRAANHAFVIDLSQMQEFLSAKAKGVRQEFTVLCDGLLHSLVEKVESQVLTSPNSRLTEAEESLEWVVRLLGGFALGNRKNQEVLQRGSPPTILGRLCNLPFRYFLEPQLQAVLFPTLISICHENVTNRDAVENDLSTELLASFLEDNRGGYYQCHEKRRRQGPDEDESRNAVKDHPAGDSPWRRFSLRFPLDLWEPAIDFLSDPKEQSRELPSEGAPRA